MAGDHAGAVMDPQIERALAALTIAASEGAVALARAERDWEPFDLVESALVTEAQRAHRARHRR